MPTPAIAAIIVAAGRGQRAARDAATGTGGLPKQFVPLAGVAMIKRTLTPFLRHSAVGQVAVVIHPDDMPLLRDAVGDDMAGILVAHGGATRQQSVAAGLAALASSKPDFVLIHDAARPFVSPALINRIVAGFEHHDAILPALAVADTLKRCDHGTVTGTIDRSGLYAAQTPQGFRYDTIDTAHRRALAEGLHDFTDDTGLVEWAGGTVHIVPGDRSNHKLTTADDMTAAEQTLNLSRLHGRLDVRTGHGFDVHAFAAGDHVILCGVKVAHDRALTGHSDADVGLHALTDAILGALCDGDIGQHFPPSDPQWKGASSDQFLAHAVHLVAARDGQIAHLDVTLICEAPKIGPHRDAMRQRIAQITGIAVSRISVKATTTEQLGFTGRREGIAAQATATIRLPHEVNDGR